MQLLSVLSAVLFVFSINCVQYIPNAIQFILISKKEKKNVMIFHGHTYGDIKSDSIKSQIRFGPGHAVCGHKSIVLFDF